MQRSYQATLLGALTIACALSSTVAQVSVTASTAGIDPNMSSPQFSPGLNGLSTGSTVVFTALATGPTPSIVRQTLTLTGEALSAYEASILTDYSQALGSKFGYETTTGNQIPGVAATVPGGYNEERSTAVATVTPGSRSGGTNAAAHAINVPHASSLLTTFGLVGAAVLGAVVVL